MIGLAPLAEIAQDLRTGRLSLSTFLQHTCDLIDERDSQIHAFLPEPDRRNRLLGAAAELETRFPHPAHRPLLFGVPVGVKDLFNVDGFPTRAGSQLPPGLFDGPEASVVRRLRAAGALVLGKTAMDEFAYAEPAPTRNPHHLEHTPGGSSSGSAAAVAAGFCPLALGTQTTRSTIGPAAYCGLVGFKPSYGRIPIDGAVFLAPSFDTVGLLTQDVAGMHLAASVLCDNWIPVAPERQPVLGVPEGILLQYMSDEARLDYEAQLVRLEGAGYQVRRLTALRERYDQTVYDGASALLHGEMAQVHSAWFADHETLYRPRTAKGVRRGLNVSSTELAEARAGGMRLRNELQTVMSENGVDLLVTPSSSGPAPLGLETTGSGGMTAPWSYVGFPCLSLPAGAIDGLPIGLQFIAPFGADEALLGWAGQIPLRG